MSTVTSAQPMVSPAGPADSGVYRFTIGEYERMVLDDPRVELIDGQVVRKMGKNPPHSWCTKALINVVPPLIPIGLTYRVEQPVRIPDHDEPEPDFAIVRGTDNDYQDRHPEPADVAVLIEVSESSLPRDRGKRLSTNARCGIPVYWIINLNDRQVEIYTEPKGGKSPAYRRRTDFASNDKAPLVIEGNEVAKVPVIDLLPSDAPAGST